VKVDHVPLFSESNPIPVTANLVARLSPPTARLPGSDDMK
jgi:hypothetical protein